MCEKPTQHFIFTGCVLLGCLHSSAETKPAKHSEGGVKVEVWFVVCTGSEELPAACPTLSLTWKIKVE